MIKTTTMNNELFNRCVSYALAQSAIKGESFKDTNLRVYTRRVSTPRIIFKALRKQGIIIPEVSGALFGQEEQQAIPTVLLDVSEPTDEVRLYIPTTEEVRNFPIGWFATAWEAAGGRCTTAFKPSENTYAPKLIDLKHVELPESFYELREAIAENAHDTWALERQSEGWTYGPERNDQLLETPDMVPYSQLSESEKEYDRIMADDTLKLLIALGYKIEKA